MLLSTYGEAALRERTYRECFNASRAMILMPRIGMAVEKGIGKIIGSDSTSHFETP